MPPASASSSAASRRATSRRTADNLTADQRDGSEEPNQPHVMRSRNAQAQARHRAKRKAYILQLERTVMKLQSIMALTPDEVDAIPSPVARLHDLEEENELLHEEVAELKRQLEMKTSQVQPGSPEAICTPPPDDDPSDDRLKMSIDMNIETDVKDVFVTLPPLSVPHDNRQSSVPHVPIVPEDSPSPLPPLSAPYNHPSSPLLPPSAPSTTDNYSQYLLPPLFVPSTIDKYSLQSSRTSAYPLSSLRPLVSNYSDDIRQYPVPPGALASDVTSSSLRLSLEYAPEPSTLLSHYHHRGLSLSYGHSALPPPPRYAHQPSSVNVAPQFTIPQDSNAVPNTTHYSSVTLNAGLRGSGVAQRSSDF